MLSDKEYNNYSGLKDVKQMSNHINWMKEEKNIIERKNNSLFNVPYIENNE